MQFTVPFGFMYRYWNQLHTKHENLFSISLESEQNQGTEKLQFVAVEVFIYSPVYLYLIIELCLFV